MCNSLCLVCLRKVLKRMHTHCVREKRRSIFHIKQEPTTTWDSHQTYYQKKEQERGGTEGRKNEGRREDKDGGKLLTILTKQIKVRQRLHGKTLTQEMKAHFPSMYT